jgi:hypothetical protein
MQTNITLNQTPSQLLSEQEPSRLLSEQEPSQLLSEQEPSQFWIDQQTATKKKREKRYVPLELSELWVIFQGHMDEFIKIIHESSETAIVKRNELKKLMKIKGIEISELMKTLITKEHRSPIFQRYKHEEIDKYDLFFEAWFIMHVEDMFKNLDEDANNKFIPLKKIKNNLYEDINFFLEHKLFTGHDNENKLGIYTYTMKEMKYYFDLIKKRHGSYTHALRRDVRSMLKEIGKLKKTPLEKLNEEKKKALLLKRKQNKKTQNKKALINNLSSVPKQSVSLAGKK